MSTTMLHSSMLALLPGMPYLQQLAAHRQTPSSPALMPSPNVPKEALVQNALNILALEAGLSEETMKTLRHAVQSGE